MIPLSYAHVTPLSIVIKSIALLGLILEFVIAIIIAGIFIFSAGRITLLQKR